MSLSQQITGRTSPSWLIVLAAALMLAPLYVAPVVAQEEAPATDAEATPAEEPAVDAEPAAVDTEAAEAELALRQSRVADKYARLEQLMLRMAEIDGAANPRRAKLLRQAVAQSKDQLTRLTLEAVVKQLNSKQYQSALTNQSQARSDLKSLLELLLTEDRGDTNRSEQARVKEYIKELNRIIRIQRGVSGRTESGDDPDRLAREQGKVGERTGNLDDQIAGDSAEGEGKEGEGSEGEPKEGEGAEGEPKEGDPNEGEGKEGEGKQGEGKQGEGKQGEGKQGEGKQGEGKQGEGKQGEGKQSEGKEGEGKEGEPKEGEGKEGEPKEGEGTEGEPKEGEPKESEPKEGEGKQGEGQQGEGQEGEGQEGEGQEGQEGQQGQPQQGQQGQQGEGQEGQQQQGQQEEMSPARKRIQAAEEKMKEAQRKLEEARRGDAREAQREAEAELEKAIAELEEILRQLREEEIERMLAMLESRFRKMLEMQLRVYESTIRLSKTPEESRTPAYDIQAGRLSGDQRKIVVEADRAMLLLREEGSSVAFPEAVDQMREDMDQIANRLAAVKVGRLTQGLEEDVISALEEMIEALQKAQQDAEQRQQQQQQQQQQQPGDQPLVDQIAELKMIKALQIRVNKRTSRYALLLEDEEDPVGQVTDTELGDALQKLSERQQRIFEVTRDIVLGKNQ